MILLPFHIAFMSAAFLSMLGGIFAARFRKSRKWWFKAHRAFQIAAVACLVAGLVFALAMVRLSGGSESGIPHRLLGAVSIASAGVIAVLGFTIFKLKDKDSIAARKRLHRYLGRGEALLMAGTMLVALFLIGVL